jgi:putative PIN family toxin of toxin-antitoxin system
VRVILDTNVIVSGIFFSGPPYQLLDAWRNEQFIIVLSPNIFKEYQRVATALNRKYPNVNIHPILELIADRAEFILPTKFNSQVCEDPDDDMFLECAASGNINTIVSGDKHLLKVSGFQNIEVLKPADFIDKYFG